MTPAVSDDPAGRCGCASMDALGPDPRPHPVGRREWVRARAAPAARRAGALSAASLVLLVTALAGCGSSTAAGPASGTVPTASSPASPQALAAVSRAVADTLSLTGAFELGFSNVPVGTQSAAPRQASGVADFRGPSATIQLDLPASSGGTERMVFFPDTVFIKPPPSSPPLQAGRPWIFANFADIAKYRVNFPPYIVQTESVNPAFLLYELSWGAVSAAPLGKTTFGGQETQAYVVRVDLVRALSHSAGPAGDVFGRALTSEITSYGAGAATTDPTTGVEVWVDAANRLVGARNNPPGAGIGTLTLTVGRFGVPVHVEKPLRSTVVDIAAMIPGGEQEALNGGDSDGA